MKKWCFAFGIIACGFEISAIPVWNHKENMPAVARHRTTGFALGTKGYIGLGHYNSGPLGNVVLGDFWQYDPATDSWTQVADFGGGLRYHCSDFTYDGKAYVFGGRDDIGFLYNDLWCYDPLDNSWVPMSPMPSWNRRATVGFTIGDYGIIATGELQGAPTFYGKDTWLYHVPTDSWSPGPDIPGEERGSAVGFSMDNKGYLGTGMGIFGALTDFYELKLTPVPAWISRPAVGSLPRTEAYGFALNGTGYVLTGGDFSGITSYSDMWKFDTTSLSWTQIMDFPGLARRYLDGFEIGTRAYMGVGTNGTNFKDLWEYDPSHLLKLDDNLTTVPVITQTEGQITFIFSELAQSVNSINIWSLGGKMMLFSPITDGIAVIDKNALSPGCYIYTVINGETILSGGKFVLD